MHLKGSQHEDRFAQMEKTINTRHPEFFFYAVKSESIDEELPLAIDTLTTQMKIVGPFGPHFLKERRTQYKSHLYDIPLQRLFIERDTENYEAVAFIASNPYASIMLKSIFEYIQYPAYLKSFNAVQLSVACIQTAITPTGQLVVISAEMVDDLKPLAIYEHPPNGRLHMAAMGEEWPDHSALVMYGTKRPLAEGLYKTLSTATSLYNDFEHGNCDRATLSIGINKLFTHPK